MAKTPIDYHSHDTSVTLSGAEKNSTETEDFAVTSLLPLIASCSCPAFITDARTGTVITANSEVYDSINGREPVGRPLEQFIPHLEKVNDELTLAYFNKKWLVYEKKSFNREECSYYKVSLHEHPDLPGDDLIATVNDMIAVMLHRFRSPMTGMQGYLELLLDESGTQQEKKRIDLLNNGLYRLNEMLNEMEELYRTKNESDIQPLYPQAVLREICDDLEPQDRNRIRLHQNGKDRPVRSNRKKLRKLIETLITNALEHHASHNEEIIIELESTRRIVITNFGEPISDYVKNRMFLPFMTDKAQNMGIGLTQAHLLAQFIGASVMLTRNSKEEGISFTILLPPPAYPEYA